MEAIMQMTNSDLARSLRACPAEAQRRLALLILKDALFCLPTLLSATSKFPATSR